MNFLTRLTRFPRPLWTLALLGAGVFLLWIDVAHIRRIEYISGLAEPAVTVDAASSTGYAGGLRRLIVPEHNNESYQWIAQTQQMLATGERRVRHVDYDNAPVGREVRSPSPYRWWLGIIAWGDHRLSGHSLGQSAERAALFADPALLLLMLAGTVMLAVRQFGGFAGALLALGWVTLFPLAGVFLPGQPNDGSLAIASVFWSVLLLLIGIAGNHQNTPSIGDPACAGKRKRRWFLAAGIAGGFSLWVSIACGLAVLGGIAFGGILAACLTQASPKTSTEITPWRIWGLGGAAMCLVGYGVEYFPAHMEGLRLETIHPLYGVAWLGLSELLHQAAAWGRKEHATSAVGVVARVGFATLAVASLLVVLAFTGWHQVMADAPFASRLTTQPVGTAAPDLLNWIYRDGFSGTILATFLPLLLLVPALWLLTQRTIAQAHREAIAVAIGPVSMTLAFACSQLGWWSLLDGMLLALLVAVFAAMPTKARPRPWLWFGCALIILIPGAMLLVSQTRAAKRDAVSEGDVVALVERDLAYWLANQATSEDRVVLAPPSLTTSLYFHGDLAGLGTPYWENKDGFTAAVRIAGATSLEEAQAVAQRRTVGYIVLPSWDPFMDEYARLGSGSAEHSLVALLHEWLPPRWLRPVPYHVPKIPGFEGLSVAVFRVCDVQDNSVALGRLAEYFLEMEHTDQAVMVSQALGRLFPSDLGAWVSRALVEQARGNATGFTEAVNALLPYIEQGEDDALPWDRRVSLAIALTEGKRFEQAKEQTKRCLAEIDEARLRSLTTVALYRLHVLSKAFGLEITNPRIHELSRRLLPPEMQGNL